MKIHHASDVPGGGTNFFCKRMMGEPFYKPLPPLKAYMKASSDIQTIEDDAASYYATV